MSTETRTLTQDDEAEIKALLLGRRIVKADEGSFPSVSEWSDNTPSGRLTLDDGTIVYVQPNQGGCSCAAGDYDLTHLATVDNVITDVRLTAEAAGDDDDEPDTSYRIYVVADAVEINAVQIDGNDGNGYYGTGYELFVVAAGVSGSPTGDGEQR